MVPPVLFNSNQVWKSILLQHLVQIGCTDVYDDDALHDKHESVYHVFGGKKSESENDTWHQVVLSLNSFCRQLVTMRDNVMDIFDLLTRFMSLLHELLLSSFPAKNLLTGRNCLLPTVTTCYQFLFSRLICKLLNQDVGLRYRLHTVGQ